MNDNDIKLSVDDDFLIYFAGGSMVLGCKKCKKRISHQEVSFPGTKEQQKPILELFENKKKTHKC